MVGERLERRNTGVAGRRRGGKQKTGGMKLSHKLLLKGTPSRQPTAVRSVVQSWLYLRVSSPYSGTDILIDPVHELHGEKPSYLPEEFQIHPRNPQGNTRAKKGWRDRDEGQS